MRYFKFISIFACVILLMACEKVSSDAVDLNIDFSWSQNDRGSSANPIIHVAGYPETTIYFSVTLTDLDKKSYDHGGGRVENDGSGIIARGSLEGNYEGPNPPRQKKHSYEIEVKAFDKDDIVIGIGKMTKSFPPD